MTTTSCMHSHLVAWVTYWWVVLIELGLDVIDSFHGKLHGIDALVRQARVEQSTFHSECPHGTGGSAHAWMSVSRVHPEDGASLQVFQAT